MRGLYHFGTACVLCISLACLNNPTATAQGYTAENLFYLGSGRAALEDFRAHADEISIICPAAYQIDADGVISGDVDPRVLDIASAHGIKVMPLFATFDQQGVHHLVSDSAARKEAIRLMLFYAEKYHYYGWQLDLENVSFLDRDGYTSFFLQAADSLHKHGLIISMAVVKSEQPAPQAGNAAYQRFLYRDWRGAFDIAAIARAADFISYMTYDQHTANTPPGPVAGMPWMQRMLQHLLDLGVPPEKISWGIPGYSDYWYPTYNDKDGARSTRDEISYADAQDLIDRYHAKVSWMEDQQVSYAYWENNGIFNWLFLEDARSFAPKFQLAKAHHLRGISVWVMGTEDPTIWELLKKEAQTARIR